MSPRVVAAVLALGLASPLAAHAEEGTSADPAADARNEYAQGTQAFQAKKYADAALHFEAAASFRPHAVALYTAGLAWDLASKPERAADAYARALDVPGLDPKQTATAKDRVATIEKVVGTLVVTGAEGTKVQLESMSEAPVPARLHGPAGSQALGVRVPGRPVERREVSLEVGKVVEIDLEKQPPKPAPAEPDEPAEVGPSAGEPSVAPPSTPSRDGYWIPRRVIGVGVAGLGVAALGASAVLGISANGAKDAYDAGPTRESFDHASSLQTWTNVALIGGGALLAAGIVLVVLPDGDGGAARLRVGVGPGGGAIGGTF